MIHARITSCLCLLLGLAGACGGAATAPRTVPEASGGNAGDLVPVAGSGGRPVAVATGGSVAPEGGPSLSGSGGSQPGDGNPGTGGVEGVGTVGSAGTGGRGAAASDGGVSDAVARVDAITGTGLNQGNLPSVTLHLAGDSTVMTYAQPTATADEGWGQELGQFLIAKVAIDNQAIGGASVASFHASSRWTNIVNAIKPGDYVMAAFGANDSGTTGDRHVAVPDFQALFLQMADEVKAKQGTFIPVTPSAFREFTGVKEGNVRLGPYAAATIAAGMMRSLLVDDLNARGVELLGMIGPSGAALLYKGVDKAHFTKAGAVQMAKFVAEELGRIGSPLGAYLK